MWWKRKITITQFLREFTYSCLCVYLPYSLIGWELNPLKWDFPSKILALILICVYFPITEAKRANKKQKDQDYGNKNT